VRRSRRCQVKIGLNCRYCTGITGVLTREAWGKDKGKRIRDKSRGRGLRKDEGKRIRDKKNVIVLVFRGGWGKHKGGRMKDEEKTQMPWT
jgi:hypothetical protein